MDDLEDYFVWVLIEVMIVMKFYVFWCGYCKMLVSLWDDFV